MLQKSLFPEEIADKKISPKRKRNMLRRKFIHFIEVEGYYNYCMIVLQIREVSDEYCAKNYGLPKESLLILMDDVFARACMWSETIEGFLEKTRTIPGYNLVYIHA